MKHLTGSLILITLCTFSLAGSASQESGDAETSCSIDSGKKQYNKCIACHSVEPDVQLMGPSLHGLMGRQIGTAQGFAFSDAMKQAGFDWTEETLATFLENPLQYVPGTVMPFGGIRKAAQREALICYLKQLK